MNDLGGTAIVDSSPYGNNGTLHGGAKVCDSALPAPTTTSTELSVTLTPTIAATPRANLSGTWRIYGVGTTTGCTDAAPPPLGTQTGSQNNGQSNFQPTFAITQGGSSISGLDTFNNSMPLVGSINGNVISFQVSNFGGTRVPFPSTLNFVATRQGVGIDPVDFSLIIGIARGTYPGSDTAGYGCQYAGGFTIYMYP